MSSTTPAREDAASGQADPASRDRAVRLHIHDHDLKTLYANAFRLNASADELFLDLGINTITTESSREPSDGEGRTTHVRFDTSHRVVMNYYTAKRLAIVLGNMVRQHEQQFGELKLDVADRRIADHSPSSR